MQHPKGAHLLPRVEIHILAAELNNGDVIVQLVDAEKAGIEDSPVAVDDFHGPGPQPRGASQGDIQQRDLIV